MGSLAGFVAVSSLHYLGSDMTTQSSDVVIYEGKKYDLAGISGDLYFNPERHGVTLGRDCTSTACYQGYICVYEINNNNLFLKDLHNIATPTGELNGTKATKASVRDEMYYSTQFCYKSVHIYSNYTGGLLIADDFIPELCDDMGFNPAWKYKTVIELVLENGHLKKVHNASDPAAEFRMKFVNKAKAPEPITPDLIQRINNGEAAWPRMLGEYIPVQYDVSRKWIEETFSLQYSD